MVTHDDCSALEDMADGDEEEAADDGVDNDDGPAGLQAPDSESSTTTQEGDSEAVPCIKCAKPTAKPFRFKARCSLDEAVPAGEKQSSPYCRDCTEELARNHLGVRCKKRLGSRDSSQERERLAVFLFYRCNAAERLVLADWYGFCRCCLDLKARVETPGQPCDACRGLPRCGFCGRFCRHMTSAHDHPVCHPCVIGIKNAAGANRPRQRSRAKPETTSDRRVSWPICIDCMEPTEGPRRKYCRVCRETRKRAPGEKCSRCRLQPKPEGYKQCEDCRIARNPKLSDWWRLVYSPTEIQLRSDN